MPSALFISVTDCSSPKPRAAGTARPRQDAQARGERAPRRGHGRRGRGGVVLCVPNKALAMLPFSNQLSQRALPNPFKKKAEAQIRGGGVGSYSERGALALQTLLRNPAGKAHRTAGRAHGSPRARPGEGALSPRDS